MDDSCKKPTNLELSNKIIAMMKLFEGKDLKEFPIESATRWLNGKLISIDRGKVELEYSVRPEMTNPSGFLHGGIQATMLDDAIGTIGATLGYEVAILSIDMHIDYLGISKNGDKLTAIAEIEREGGNIIHASAVLKRKDGELVAKVQSNLLISNQPAAYLDFIETMK